MKKRLLGILLICCCLIFCSALAEEWNCPGCDTVQDGNFCIYCGTKKPSDEWECPSCGMVVTGKFCYNCGQAKADAGSVPAPVTADRAEDAEFIEMLNYLLAPVNPSGVAEVVDDGYMLTVQTKDSTTYYVFTTSAGLSISASEVGENFEPIEHAYDVQDSRFVQVVNYILKESGTEVDTITQIVGDLYTLTDTAGKEYTLTVVCMPSIVSVGVV